MDLKRVLTTILGLPIVILIFVFGNKYIMNSLIMIASIICMYEYFGAVKKVSKPIEWVGYLSNIFIILASFFQEELLLKMLLLEIPVIILILFLHVIISDMKITFKDVLYTFFGIIYIPVFLTFLALIRCKEDGRVLLLGTLVIAWATDIFAYLVGKFLGKHKFTKISPNKTIEGTIGGTVGAIISILVYTLILNKFLGMQYLYLQMAVIGLALSLISQIGDLIASSIKRLVDVKDYGNLIPGHGGMLDRIDSLLFISPFAYMIFMIL